LVVQGDADPQFIFSKLPGVVSKTLPRNPTHTSVTFLIVGLHAIDDNSALQFLFVKKLETVTMNLDTLSLHGFTAEESREVDILCGMRNSCARFRSLDIYFFEPGSENEFF
jgi:hypothetical protein